MKRIFTAIIILISFSLIGIIYIQINWLRNMIVLQRSTIKENVDKAVLMIGEDLEKYKGNYLPGTRSNIFPENFSPELLTPMTIGKRFTAVEMQAKIREAFQRTNLENVHFEFLLAVTPRNGVAPIPERESPGFRKEYEDTVNNYPQYYPLYAPSGSLAENLALDETLFLVALDVKKAAIQELWIPIAMAILFTIIIIAAFYLTIRTMLRQKKLGEIKNDFINNMTHEFKTPIATISLAVDALKNEKVMGDKEKMKYFSGIIKEENQRMNRQVETILKASQMERNEVDLNLQPLHAHDIIREVVENFSLQLEDKHGMSVLQLEAANDYINGDEVHFTNLVNNLVDNAVKYAKENHPLLVKVSTQSNNKNFILRVEDNGIGMSKETVKRIFERFYRAHTGNLHNVKGFGLGLSYVQTMVNAHGGTIRAESTLGKGSTFIVELPLKK